VVRLHIGMMPGPCVSLAIVDTGSDMDAATRGRVFESFFTTKAPGKGSGMGLSVVYGVVSQLGGQMSVESTLGQGRPSPSTCRATRRRCWTTLGVRRRLSASRCAG
jgi:K+-sensing histidine kinase KdpD